MSDLHALVGIVRDIKPTEVYNLAAQSHVQVSFQMPMFTAEVDGVGVLNIMEAIRLTGQTRSCKFTKLDAGVVWQSARDSAVRNDAVLSGRSPYAVAKMMGYWAVVNYRESYDMFACNGFVQPPIQEEGNFCDQKNHFGRCEHQGREPTVFVLGQLGRKKEIGGTPEITSSACGRFYSKTNRTITLSRRALEMTTAREFAARAFKHAGMELEFKGDGVEEHGVEKATGKTLLRVYSRYFRPAEVEQLLGNPTKAKEKLKWDPRQTSLKRWSRRWWTRISREFKTRTFITD